MPIVIGALVVVADQIVKLLCANWLPTLDGGSYPLIEGVLHLTYVENRGAAFGLLQDAQVFFFVMTVILCALLMWFLVKNYSKLHTALRLSLVLILAGALGNFIDRVALSYVRDMIDFCLINFYVFNIADAALTIGTIITVVDLLFFKGNRLLAQYEEKSKERKLKKRRQNEQDEDREQESV